MDNLKQARHNTQAHVEDIAEPSKTDFEQNIPVDLLQEGFFFLDEDIGSENDSDDEDSGYSNGQEDEGGVVTDAALSNFSRMLATAQLAAIEAERKARQEKPKRKHHYTGNAPRTKCYHAQKQQKVVETGQSFIHHQFFMRSKCLPELAASSREESGEEDGDM